MKIYVITIITVSVVGGIISTLLSNDSGIKKHVNFIVGLICAITLLSPVANIAKSASVLSDTVENAINKLDISESISQSNKIIIEEGTEQISKGILEALITKYKFTPENVQIDITVNNDRIDAITLEKITVTLKNEATWTDLSSIKQYLENLVGCEVVIKKI